MSPDQIVALTSLLSIMDKMAGWPFGLLFFVIIIGPWLLSVMLAWSYRKRFDAVVVMYENNAMLVKNYENMARDLKDVIMLNIQVNTELVQAIKTNQFCPAIRLEKLSPGRVE